uniref:Glycosyltransferase n=1 Tax=Rheinheimera sp. BAL341 TaxID=1708203 RepID=A0A486XXK8_9GAMM
MKKVAAFTQGCLVPSTRFRISQYEHKLRACEIELVQFDAKVSAYPPAAKWQRPWWLLQELIHRVSQLGKLKSYDVVILQREMISTLATVERFINKPIILDVDDAIFLRRNGRAARQLAQKAQHIVCGNQYLADYFRQYNAHITVIPTAVDTQRFLPSATKAETYIGWSGSSSGFHFLYAIEAALRSVLLLNPGWKLHIVADKPPTFTVLEPEQVVFEKWSPETEVQSIQKMAIGIMPLDDSAWTKGKCSYKMLLYMACGLPVVVSDVGMNAQLLKEAEIGLGTRSDNDWIQHLQQLIDDAELRNRFGIRGRQLVEEQYSLQYCTAKWLQVLDGEQFS